VKAADRLVDDLADAILDGTPIDWTAADSSAEAAARPLLKQLKVAGSHRQPAPGYARDCLDTL